MTKKDVVLGSRGCPLVGKPLSARGLRHRARTLSDRSPSGIVKGITDPRSIHLKTALGGHKALS